MRLLIVGSGSVGTAAAEIAARLDVFTHVICADIDPARAEAAAATTEEPRFEATAVDASDKMAVVRLLRGERLECVLNAADARYKEPILKAARAAGATYVDLTRPDAELARHADWRDAGQLALVAMGASPGLTEIFARFAREQLFSTVDDVQVADRDKTATIAVEISGTGQDGGSHRVRLSHVIDDAPAAQQTALCAVVALELIADRTWIGAGVLGPDAFDPVPFLERLAAHDAPHAVEDLA